MPAPTAPPSLPRQKAKIMQTDRRCLARTGQPLQHLRAQIGESQLSADVPFRQSHGLGQFLNGGELTGSMRRRQPSAVGLIKFQGPRIVDQGPRTLALRPSEHQRRIERRGPRFLERGPRSPIANMLYYNNHDGGRMKFTKGNLVGFETRFGPNWTGSRCGARTRSGTACRKAAMTGRARCRNHGGCATGARTAEGRARIAAAQTKHGRLIKEKRAEARRRAQVGREIRAELRKIERELVAGGLLAKAWRDQFDWRGRSDESDEKS